MSNVSQNIMEEYPSLSYSSSESNGGINHNRLTDSLQYLDRIRSINRKIFTAQNLNDENKNSLERLVSLNKEITYVDNEKMFGIVKVESFNKLKTRLRELEEQSEIWTKSEQNMKTESTMLRQKIEQLLSREAELENNLELIQQSLDAYKILRADCEQTIQTLNESLNELTSQRVQDSHRYLALQNDFQTYKYTQEPEAKQSTYKMISETQTDYLPFTISISPYEPNIEEILKDIKSKEDEKISPQNLKEIVAQSLDNFVKQLDAQYELIQKQNIDLNQLQEYNARLTEENAVLTKKLEEISIEESKLGIFKTCMTEFLQKTTEKVTKSIEADKAKNKPSLLAQPQLGVIINSEQESEKFPEKTIESHQLNSTIEQLKKENIRLIKTLGEYQYKWKNVEKVLEENKKETIPDDGTVGQLVKMSKLVKESIKNLLHEL